MRFETQIIECFSRHLNKTKLMDYCWTHIRQGCIFFKSPFFFHALYAHFDTFYGLKMGQHAYIALTMPKNHRFPLKKAQKTPNFAIFHLFWVYFFPQTGRGLFFSPPHNSSYFEVNTSQVSVLVRLKLSFIGIGMIYRYTTYISVLINNERSV